MIFITTRVTQSFTGIQRADNDRRIGLWGRLHGGNLSLTNAAVNADPALKNAFEALGADVWNAPQSTPHGGTNYYRTKTGISWEETVLFLANCGYTLAGAGDNPQPASGGTLDIRGLSAVTGGFDSVRDIFSRNNRFHRYKPGGDGSVSPGRGVYVICHNTPGGDAIVYIGKTGGFSRDDKGALIYGGPSFAQRFSGIYPYSFTTKGMFANHFEYAPNASVNELKELPEAERYQQHLPFESITVDCYVTDGIEKEVSPSYLEAFLLQTYMAQHGSLPPANNEF
jgi:hypothetical protein